MSKVVLVISFDEPKTEEEFNDTIGEALVCAGQMLDKVSNRHVWFGVKDKADAVLKVIGVSDG